jgi:hypothetical protein
MAQETHRHRHRNTYTHTHTHTITLECLPTSAADAGLHCALAAARWDSPSYSMLDATALHLPNVPMPHAPEAASAPPHTVIRTRSGGSGMVRTLSREDLIAADISPTDLDGGAEATGLLVCKDSAGMFKARVAAEVSPRGERTHISVRRPAGSTPMVTIHEKTPDWPVASTAPRGGTIGEALLESARGLLDTTATKPDADQGSSHDERVVGNTHAANRDADASSECGGTAIYNDEVMRAVTGALREDEGAMAVDKEASGAAVMYDAADREGQQERVTVAAALTLAARDTGADAEDEEAMYQRERAL